MKLKFLNGCQYVAVLQSRITKLKLSCAGKVTDWCVAIPSRLIVCLFVCHQAINAIRWPRKQVVENSVKRPRGRRYFS